MALGPTSARDKQQGLIRSDIAQTLTAAQRSTARGNIGVRDTTPAAGSGITATNGPDNTRTLALNGFNAALRDLDSDGFVIKSGSTAVIRFLEAGGGITISLPGGALGNPTIAMGTPSPITRESTNSTTPTSHSHALTQTTFRDMLANYTASGQIGELCFAVNTGSSQGYGGSTAGSNLRPATGAGTASGSSLPGTWKCLGNGVNDGVTLWRRIT